jgi:hypothetical protein
MSRLLTAKEICERSLRAIGEFPLSESAASPEQLREAMFALDLILGELAGTTRLFNLVTANLSVVLTNGTTEYVLSSALGADLPLDRVQFPVLAWLEDTDGNRRDVLIATREKFEAVSKGTDSGEVCMIHIDRTVTAPTLRIYKTPATTDTTTWTLKLVVQTYAPNVAPGGVTGSTPSGSVLHGFHQAWQRWMVLQLNIDLGSGGIVKLPQASLNNWRTEATPAKEALLAFQNREHDTEPPIADSFESYDDNMLSDSSYYPAGMGRGGGRY